MRTVVSCLTAAVFFITGVLLTDRAEAGLIRLKNGEKFAARQSGKTEPW